MSHDAAWDQVRKRLEEFRSRPKLVPHLDEFLAFVLRLSTDPRFAEVEPELSMVTLCLRRPGSVVHVYSMEHGLAVEAPARDTAEAVEIAARLVQR